MDPMNTPEWARDHVRLKNDVPIAPYRDIIGSRMEDINDPTRGDNWPADLPKPEDYQCEAPAASGGAEELIQAMRDAGVPEVPGVADAPKAEEEYVEIDPPAWEVEEARRNGQKINRYIVRASQAYRFEIPKSEEEAHQQALRAAREAAQELAAQEALQRGEAPPMGGPAQRWGNDGPAGKARR